MTIARLTFPPRWLTGASSGSGAPNGSTRPGHPSAWASAILTEADRLQSEVDRLPQGSMGMPDRRTVDRSIGDAVAIAGAGYPGPVRELVRFVCGRSSSRCLASAGAWAALHRADEGLVALETSAALRARAAKLSADLGRSSLDRQDPRIAGYQAAIRRVSNSRTRLTGGDREAIRAIQRTVNEQLACAYRNLKSFRMVLIGVTVVLTLAVVATGLAGMLDTQIFAACASAGCPHGAGADRFDALEIALVGSLGGLLSAVLTLRGMRGFGGPFGLYTAQAALKVPVGAGLALLGVMFMQHDLLGPLESQAGDRVFAFAALFGFSQQLLTRLVDRQASTIIGEARGRDDPGIS